MLKILQEKRMDEAARKILKSKKSNIVKNLIVTDSILDFLEDKNVLTEDMVQSIKAEKTDNDKVVKLLFLLTRRGPHAFNEFVEAIRPEFGFLSEMLEGEYYTELENLQTSNADSVNDAELPRVLRENSDDHDFQPLSHPNNILSNNFICRHCQQVKTTNEMSEKEKSISGNSDFMQRMMQESFGCWYTKLKSHMTNKNLRELSFKSPEPVTYDMVDKLLDELIQTVDGCYRVLGVKDNLVTHVINLKESKKKLKQEVKEREEQKNKYADNIIKLENKCRDNKEYLETEKRCKQKLHAENVSLREEMKATLHQKNKEIEEHMKELNDAKEKIKKLEKLLQDAEDQITDLNEYVKSYELQTGVLNWQLQGSKLQRNNETNRSKSTENNHNITANQKKKSTRRARHSMFTDSTIHTSVKSKQESGQLQKTCNEAEDITAVEEPDGWKQSTESTVEKCIRMSVSPDDFSDCIASQSSDKENDDFKNQQNLTDRSKETVINPNQPQLLTGNNSCAVNGSATKIKTTKARKSIFRRTSYVSPQRYTPADQLQTNFGIIGSNTQNFQRGTRRFSEASPRVLDTLVIVSNSPNKSHSTQNDSPRGPKAMKKHH